jgi:hypothetical protein
VDSELDYQAETLEPLRNAASQQFGRLRVGDTVWIATAPSGRLTLVGKLVVGEITDREGAAARLGVEPDDLWDADHHILAADGTADLLREIDVSHVAAELRFESTTSDRLRLEKGRVNPSQLQSLRRLTAEFADLLQSIWNDAVAAEDAEGEETLRGAGFGSSESNRAIELAAIAAVTRLYRERDWQVESVERERVGYDLLCTAGVHEEHVEVKGIQGDRLSFPITAGELRRGDSDPDFVLCVVTAALSDQPRIEWWRGEEIRRSFSLVPLVYMARLRPE